MQINEFLSQIEKNIEKMTQNEIRIWIREYARKLSEKQRLLLLESFSQIEAPMNQNDIDEQMEWASDWLDEVEDGNRAIYYVTAHDWWDEYESEYADNIVTGHEDRDGFIPELVKVLDIIERFVMQHQYEDAAELFHRLFHLEVVEKIIWYYDQSEIDENYIAMDRLISIYNLDKKYYSYLWLYAIIQSPSDIKFAQLFEAMVKQKVMNIEVIQTIGPIEINVELFIEDWIDFLVQKEGPEAYNLIQNAYQNYKSIEYLEVNIEKLTIKHPQLYMDLLSEKMSLTYTNNEFHPVKLEKQIQQLSVEKTDEIKAIIQTADNTLTDKMMIGSELMEIGFEISKRENNIVMQTYYRKRAFQYRSSIINFLRLRAYLDEDELATLVNTWDKLPVYKNSQSLYSALNGREYLEYNELTMDERQAILFFVK